MKARLRRLVWDRAGGYCEYCQLHQQVDEVPFHLDHIIARKHDGHTIEGNLAVACANCSLGKGSNIAAIDRRTGQLTRLFNPRTDHWSQHFRWQGAKLRGTTAIGRVTVLILNINDEDRVATREGLIKLGDFPPRDFEASG